MYENISSNLIADQSIADQMKALFVLKIMNINRCIKCNYMNCNEELGSSINLPVYLFGRTNIVDLNSVLRLFLMSQSHNGTKVCVNCSSSGDLHQFKVVKEKQEILFSVFERKLIWFFRVKIERNLSIFCSIPETVEKIWFTNCRLQLQEVILEI